MINKEQTKIYSTVAEAAKIMGVSDAYVRELLNRAKIDSTIKLKGKKIGKSWRICTKSISEYLGIEVNTDDEKNRYIKELEVKIKTYEEKLRFIESILMV